MAQGKKLKEQTLKRYLWLLDALYNADNSGLTLDELSELWQANYKLSGGEPLSRNTYNKHRTAIKKVFGIEINCNRSNDKHYIKFAPGRGIGAVHRDMINAISVNDIVSKNSDLWLKIHYEGFEHAKKFTLPILRAIGKKEMIAIRYIDFGDEDKGCVFVPVFLKSIRQRWYLFGCEYSDNEYEPNIIALDCIKKLSHVGKRFKDTFDDVDEFISEHFNLNLIPISRPLSEYGVKLKAYGGLIEHLKLFPLHHTQIELDANRGYSVFEYELIPDNYFIGEILKCGERIEVIEPESLREHIGNRINKMQELYSGTK